MKPRPSTTRRTALILASSIAALLTTQPASAITYYWDSDGSTAGFGNTTGTWGTNAFWTTVATGGATHSAVTATTTADTVNFGAAALNYANGTVNIAAGGVTANIIQFGLGQTTALTLASGGGSITLDGSNRQIIANSTGHAINAPIILTGASTISFGRNTNVAGSFTLGGGMSGTGGVTFTSPTGAASGNNQQTINLGAASTYSGNTTMTTANNDTSTTIKNTSGAANALPVGTVLTMLGGNGGGSGRSVNFDLGGQDQTLAGLQNTVSSLRNQRVTNSGTLATLTINNSADYTYGGSLVSGIYTTSGQITGAIALAKSGSANFTLDAIAGNTYTGGTTITGTGKLIAQGSNTALGNAAGSVSVGSTATLQYNNNLAANVTLAISNAITGAGTLEIIASNAPSNTDLNRTSTGVLTSFTGNISVLANGNYLIGSAANVTTNQNLTIAAGGYMSTGENTGFGKLDGSGTIFRNAAANTRTLTLGNGNATGGNFGGVIRGESTTVNGLFNSLGIIAVTKVGTGTQTLSGVNTYGGATTITGGTLALSGAGSIANSPTIIVGASTTFDVSAVTGGYTLGAGQTLSGPGTVTGAMNVSGTLSPGNSPGSITTGSQTWLDGGDYNWQMLDAAGAAGTGFDQIAVTGTLDFSSLTAGGFAINLWSLSSTGPDVNGDASNFNNAVTQSWTLLTATSGISGFDAADFTINVAANNGTSGFSNALGGGAFSLGADPTNLVLTFTPVPEPNVAALIGGLGCVLLLRRRR